MSDRVRRAARLSQKFNRTYRCYSVSLFPGTDRDDVEKGGKSKRFALEYKITFFIQ